MNQTTEPNLEEMLHAADSAPRKRRLLVALALVLGGSAAWWAWGRSPSSADLPLSFLTEPLSRGSVALTVTATGNLEPTNEVTVGSELSGTILEVYVDSNDLVKKGQALAKLDPTKLTQETESTRAKLRSAQANLLEAQATLKEAEADLSRLRKLQELSNHQLPSAAEMATAEATAARAEAGVAVAEAAVEQAEAQLRVNENDLEKAVIRSPIDGIVLTRDVEPGQTVAASFTAPELFVIAESLEHMKLTVAVAEADIGRLADGQSAQFRVDAWPQRQYPAVVEKVSYGSSVTDNVVTYDTELRVENGDLTLRPGMTATVDIAVAEEKNVFLVPSAALRFKPAPPDNSEGPPLSAGEKPSERSFVQSLAPMPPRPPRTRSGGNETNQPPSPGESEIWILRDGHPEPVPVIVGISDGRRVQISSPELTEGLPVILRAQ